MKEMEAKFTVYGERYTILHRDIPTLNILQKTTDVVRFHEYTTNFEKLSESK